MSIEGERIGAEDARDLGLVNRVAPADELLEKTQAWAAERDMYVAEAVRLGIEQSPIARLYNEAEPARLAGALADAVAADLEQTTGAHVWSLFDQLASTWFSSGGAHSSMRDLLDLVRAAAQSVVGAIGLNSQLAADMLEPAVARALVVGELSVGSVLAARLRAAEQELAVQRP